MIKRFLEWIEVKTKTHNTIRTPPLTKEGDIWWAKIGDNIGQEINGKGNNFVRPVYMYKKLSNTLYMIIPMTSKIKTGSWYVSIFQNNKEVTLCLHQMRVVDYKRLMNKIGEVDEADTYNIYKAFVSLYKK
jgi:mRNA-degrading endonuclease toxin of MazEF toxin-antitoxin module